MREPFPSSFIEHRGKAVKLHWSDGGSLDNRAAPGQCCQRASEAERGKIHPSHGLEVADFKEED